MIDYLFSIEGLAVSTGLASVWFSVKERIWVYPIGLISVSIYVYLSFIYGNYADMAINIYYVLMSIYGWYRWLQPLESGDFYSLGLFFLLFFKGSLTVKYHFGIP